MTMSPNKKEHKKDRCGYGSAGSPDIFAVLPPTGQLVGIEVKDVKGKLNDNQVIFKSLLERAGGRYIVAKSLDDVTALFRPTKWKILS